MNVQVAQLSSQAPAAAVSQKGAGLLQRKCACGESAGLSGSCKECDSRKLLQRRAAGPATAVPPIVHEVLRSSGRPLDAETRAFMEPRFGHDFSHVRVHNDAQAAESARKVNALAYTVGRDVVFGRGQYTPGTASGNRLLAHELTHVVQQHGTFPGDPNRLAIRDDKTFEHEADATSDKINSGSTTPDPTVISGQSSGVLMPSLQRQSAGGAPQAAGPSSPAGTKPANCLQELSGRDFDGVFRLDTITVIKLTSKFCAPCVTLGRVLEGLCESHKAIQHPFRFRFFEIDVNPKDDNGDEIQTPEAAENRKIGSRFNAPPVPRTLIYVERELKHNSEGYLGDPQTYERILAEVLSDASKSGAVRGAEEGFHLGLGDGALGWAATILLIPLALLGAGAGLLFGALFGKEKGTKELSPDRLKNVMDFNDGKIPEKDLSHSVAEDVINFWADHRQTYQLSIYQRQVLIKNLMAGFTGDDEERGILKVLENSTDAEILQIFSLGKDPNAPNLTELEAEFQGEEREYLDQLLRRLRERFPVDPALQKTTGLLIDDTFVQGVMADSFRATHAQQQGKPHVDRECSGVFVAPKKGGSLDKETICEEGTSAGTGVLARDALKKRAPGFKIVGSFHTHPVAYPPQAREAPSGDDIRTFVQDPARGNEHYVVGPLVTYLILRNGDVRVLGKTADLLHVDRIQPKPGQVSTLELG